MKGDSDLSEESCEQTIDCEDGKCDSDSSEMDSCKKQAKKCCENEEKCCKEQKNDPDCEESISLKVRWKKIAIFLGFFTIFYNIAEGIVSVLFGTDDRSLSLLGFGIDSLIEVISGCFVLWRFIGVGKEISLKRERISTASIGVLLALLGFGTIASGIYDLVLHNKPSATVPGIIITAISITIMLNLYLLKRFATRILDSATLASDAKCSLSCVKLSVVVFLGSGIFWLDPNLWWMDSAAAILISLFITAEGIKTVYYAMSKDFAGGCGCGGEKKSQHFLLRVIDVIL